MEKMIDIYKKHKEIFNFLIFGVLTTLVKWSVYSVLVMKFLVDKNVSNIIAWACAVSFAFITNKRWVFESKSKDKQSLLREGLTFLGSRIGTGVVEIGLFPLLLALGLNEKLFGIEGFVAQVISTIVVIILNYIFSKFIVFKKANQKEDER